MNDNNVPVYLFHQGKNAKAYQFLGAHLIDGTDSVVFRVWAPHAASVSVTGDFNNWNPDAAPMAKLDDGSIWECVVSGVHQFDNYKYCITTNPTRTVFIQRHALIQHQRFITLRITAGTIRIGLSSVKNPVPMTAR